MNPQVDKEEKHLAQDVFCRRLNSALRDCVPYTSHAELWVAVGWFSSEGAFEENLAVVPTHPNLLPWQRGLSSANWIALPKSTAGLHQMGCDCWWGCSVHIAKLQIVLNHQNHCNRDTRMVTPCISQHSLLLCMTLPVIPEEPLPPFFTQLLRQKLGRCRAIVSLFSPGVCSCHWAALHICHPKQISPGRHVRRQSTPNHFQRSCFQLGQDTAESFSCRMSYGRV